ncbi:MAG: hypothetical protein ACKVJN_06795, partial [Woeseiales bacterium]
MARGLSQSKAKRFLLPAHCKVRQ